MRSEPEESIDMVLTDPMNTRDGNINVLWLSACYKLLKPGKYLCSFCSLDTLKEFTEQAKSVGFKHIQTGFRSNKLIDGEEPFIIFIKGDGEIATFDENYTEGEPIPGFPAEGQKPLDLIKKLIESFTKEGDTVMDMFLGSGTTALACKETKRNFRGCEKNFDYCCVAKKRLGFPDMSCTGI